MKRLSVAFLGVTGAAACALTPLVLPAKITVEEARAALAKAQAVSALRKEGGQAFHLRAEIRVTTLTGETEQGVYEEFWVSPTRWRREVRLPSYWGIKIVRGDQIARQRSSPIEPGRIQQLMRLMLYPSNWEKREAKTEKASDCPDPQIETRCFRMEPEYGDATTFMVDAATGAVIETTAGKSQMVFSGFAPFCGSLVPTDLRAFRDGKLAVEAEVKERKVLPAATDSLFEFPKDAVVWPWCLEPESPKADKQVKPNYPMGEASRGKMGRVIMSLIVDDTGKVTAVEVVESAGKNFDAAALKSVRQWSFKPARCGTTPIPAEHIITINFTMR